MTRVYSITPADHWGCGKIAPTYILLASRGGQPPPEKGGDEPSRNILTREESNYITYCNLSEEKAKKTGYSERTLKFLCSIDQFGLIPHLIHDRKYDRAEEVATRLRIENWEDKEGSFSEQGLAYYFGVIAFQRGQYKYAIQSADVAIPTDKVNYEKTKENDHGGSAHIWDSLQYGKSLFLKAVSLIREKKVAEGKLLLKEAKSVLEKAKRDLKTLPPNYYPEVLDKAFRKRPKEPLRLVRELLEHKNPSLVEVDFSKADLAHCR